jgi:hypothetical protein
MCQQKDELILILWINAPFAAGKRSPRSSGPKGLPLSQKGLRYSAQGFVCVSRPVLLVLVLGRLRVVQTKFRRLLLHSSFFHPANYLDPNRERRTMRTIKVF